MKSILKIYSDRECSIYKDMASVGTAAKDKPLKITLSKGQYYLILEDAGDSSKRIELDYHMEADDIEDLMRVSFASNNVSCKNEIRLLNMEQTGSLKRYVKRYLNSTGGGLKESFSILEPETNFEIPLKYDRVEYFHDGLAKVMLNGEYGYIDKAGQIVVPIAYKLLGDFHEGLAYATIRVVANNPYGFIDETGTVVIPFEYRTACDFHDGLAVVQNGDKKWGCINTLGEIVIPFRYSEAFHFANDGLAIVKNRHGFGAIDNEGVVRIPLCYEQIDRLSSTYHLFVVKQNGLYGLVDRSRSMILPVEYDKISNIAATKGNKEYYLSILLKRSGRLSQHQKELLKDYTCIYSMDDIPEEDIDMILGSSVQRRGYYKPIEKMRKYIRAAEFELAPNTYYYFDILDNNPDCPEWYNSDYCNTKVNLLYELYCLDVSYMFTDISLLSIEVEEDDEDLNSLMQDTREVVVTFEGEWDPLAEIMGDR